ncbi:hypothetical protein Tco_1212432 [Tanacetum coccineum]
MREACEDMVDFVRELRSVAGETVLAKTALFLEEMMNKEGSREWQLRDLEKEAREMDFEIGIFLLKLMDEEPSHRRVLWKERVVGSGSYVALVICIWGFNYFVNIQDVIDGEFISCYGAAMSKSTAEAHSALAGQIGNAAAEDRRFATQLNMLRREMANIYEKRRNLAYELRSFRGIIAPGKAVDFLNNTLRKDDAEMTQLCELERQIELRALKKELFI